MRPLYIKKFNSMLDNLDNGNLDCYKKQIKALTKYYLIQFILFSKEYANKSIEDLKILVMLS